MVGRYRSARCLIIAVVSCGHSARPPASTPAPVPVVEPTPAVVEAPPPPKKENIHPCPKQLVGMKDAAEVRALIAKEKCNGNANDAMDRSALMVAAERSRLEVVRALIEAGADVNEGQSGQFEQSGKTALWFAVAEQHVDVIAELLRAGADPDQAPNRAVSVFKLALRRETPDIMKLLIEAGVSKDQSMTFDGGPSAQVFAYLESVGVKSDLSAEVQDSLRWQIAQSPKPAEVAVKTKSVAARRFAIKHLGNEPPDVAVPALLAVAKGTSINDYDWGPHDAIVTLHNFEWTAEHDKLLSMVANDKRQQVRLQLLSLLGKRAPSTKSVVDTLLARLERGDDRANAATALGDLLPRASADQAKRIRKALERAAKGPTGDCKGAEQCARHQTTEAARKAVQSGP